MFSKVVCVIIYVYDFYLGYDLVILVWNLIFIGYIVVGVGLIVIIFFVFIFVKVFCMLYWGIKIIIYV